MTNKAKERYKKEKRKEMELAEFPNYLFHKEGYITSKKYGKRVGSNCNGYTPCQIEFETPSKMPQTLYDGRILK